jgi:hypothetical protein
MVGEIHGYSGWALDFVLTLDWIVETSIQGATK